MKYLYQKNTEGNYFKTLNNLIKSGLDFEVHKTNYTNVFKTKKTRIILNDNGDDNNFNLTLVNKVRSDARQYIKNVGDIVPIETGAINWYMFNPIEGNAAPEGRCLKLDINSAYWATAYNRGIITDKTMDYFLELSKDMTIKDAKKARLMALGSLATKKEILKYSDGERVSKEVRYYDELSRHLYLDICNTVSEVLKSILTNIGGIYMYWDMILINDIDTLKDTSQLLEEWGYSFTVDQTNYRVCLSDYINYIETIDHKNKIIQYPINKFDKL